MRFDGKVALVTGAAHGIGLGIARQFLEAGARVVLNDRTAASVDAGLRQLGGPQANLHGYAADVTRKDQVEAMIADAAARFGRLDIVVNNAGLYPVTPVLEMSEAEWDMVLDVNLKGAFLVSQAAARLMVRQDSGGAIVNISSGSHKIARIGCAHYCASKAGVVMLTSVLAMELAPHRIRVNAVAPGLVPTPWTKDWAPIHAMVEQNAPLHRSATAEDVADAIYGVVISRYMTGQVVVVDGGLGLVS